MIRAVIFDNFDLALNLNGAGVLLSTFKTKDFAIAGILSFIFALVELRSKVKFKKHIIYPILSLVTYLGLINYNVVYPDELSKLFLSSINYFRSDEFKDERYNKYINLAPKNNTILKFSREARCIFNSS